MNIDKTKFLGGKEASEILGVHQRTLHYWDKHDRIEIVRAPGGKRFYNVEKYLKDQNLNCNQINNKNIICNKKKEKIIRKKICYVRVSSNGQKDDLERQKAKMKINFPDYELIEDIGSGINFTRRGLLKIIEMSIEGILEELIVIHKDRLTRFGYELIEHLIKKYSNGKITILDKEEKELEPEAEMLKDVLQVMNVFVAKMNGRKKYKKNK